MVLQQTPLLVVDGFLSSMMVSIGINLSSLVAIESF